MQTKWQLINALLTGGEFKCAERGIDFKSVLAVEREDGSGKCWNVTGYDRETGKAETRFVRTVD